MEQQLPEQPTPQTVYGPHAGNLKAVSAFVAASCSLDGLVKKDADNPHFRSRYASLASVMELVAPACHEHKLALVQPLLERENGLYIVTQLIHESGQCVEFLPFPVKLERATAQGLGSAITYARRYSLLNVFGLAPDDDDGNAASNVQYQPQQQPDPLQQAAREGAARHEAPKRRITKKQRDQLQKLVDQTKTDIQKYCAHLGVDSLAAITVDQFKHALGALESKLQKQSEPKTEAES